jgi:RHS repeat-associated protein
VIDESIDNADVDQGGNNFAYDAAGRLISAKVPGHSYTYGFAAAGGCGVAGAAGKNANRTSLVIDGGTPVTYCYDHADRLTSTTATGYAGAIAYDAHGNTTTIAGETRSYDAADRHLATTKGTTTVTYTRDAADRIVARNDGTTTVKYSAGVTLDAAGNLIERTIPLPGGVLLTRRASSDVWSYPNIHGDVIATADAAGAKQGSTMHWGPYGETLTAVPDNSEGAFDQGWLGQHQRPLEHETGLASTIEMGARQYDPTLGRFLQVDPVDGGSCNDYDYVCGDPVLGRDLDGTRLCIDVMCRHTAAPGRAGTRKPSVKAIERASARLHSIALEYRKWYAPRDAQVRPWVNRVRTDHSLRDATISGCLGACLNVGTTGMSVSCCGTRGLTFTVQEDSSKRELFVCAVGCWGSEGSTGVSSSPGISYPFLTRTFFDW